MNNPQFKSEAINDETLLINPGKKIDNSNAHIMLDQINQARTDLYKYIFIDMQATEFISSAGVGSILGTVETFRNAGGDIVIFNASENILRVFEVLDLLEYLSIKKSLNEAMVIAAG